MALHSDDDEYKLPPRDQLYPSQKGKWTRLFYDVLLIVFLLLIISLISWFLWFKV